MMHCRSDTNEVLLSMGLERNRMLRIALYELSTYVTYVTYLKRLSFFILKYQDSRPPTHFPCSSECSYDATYVCPQLLE